MQVTPGCATIVAAVLADIKAKPWRAARARRP